MHRALLWSWRAQRRFLHWGYALSLALALWPTFLVSLPTAISWDLRLDGQVPVSITTRYYEIHRATPEELRRDLNASSLRAGDGEPFDARTLWIVAWSWPSARDGRCRLDQAQVTVRITIVLPRWEPLPGMAPTLITRWEQYRRHLVYHEALHAALVLADIPALVGAIHSAICTTANSAAQAVLAQIQQHNRTYDAITAHGATQGAIFP